MTKQQSLPKTFSAHYASGLSSEDAAASANVPQAVASAMVAGRQAECHQQCSGRRRSRIPEDIFRLPNARRLRFCGRKAAPYRRWARRIGRAASTISRELRRNAATRSGGLGYRASTAQWHAERSARRPKQAKLVLNAALQAYVQDRLAWAGRGSERCSCSWPVRILERATTWTAAGSPVGRVPLEFLSRSLDACRSTSRMTSHAHQP